MENPQIVITRPGDVSKLKWISKPVPEIGPHDVLIRNEATGVAFADILMREGLYPDVERKNLTPGYDVIGVVEQVGSTVHSIKAGQRVVALTQTGGYAHYTVAEAALTVPCADHLSAESAVALVLNYTTAYQMLTRVARVKPGDSILIHGVAGGVGSALLELALANGLKVYGTCSQRKWDSLPKNLNENPNLVKIDYQQAPFEQTLKQVAPQGIDAVFDAVGGYHLMRSYRCLNPGGIAVSYGFSTAMRNGRLSWLQAVIGFLQSVMFPVNMIRDNKIMAGYGIWNYVRARPEWFRTDLELLLEWLDQGRLSPMIAKKIPLEKASEAHTLVESSLLPGKVVLKIA